MRSFKQFLKESGVGGVKRISREYAEDTNATIDSLSKKYNITKYGIQKLFEYAIVNCIVCYNLAKQMQDKAHQGQVRHIGEDQHTPSDKKYEEFFKKRLEFIKNLDDDDVERIADFYINSKLFVSTIAQAMGLSIKELDIVLKKSIICNIISDDKFEELKKVNLEKISSSKEKERVSKIMESYGRIREYHKRLSDEIVQLHYQLEAYDDYALYDNDSEQHKQDLESRLAKLKQEYNSFTDKFL